MPRLAYRAESGSLEAAQLHGLHALHRLGRLEESGVLRGEDALVVVGHGLAGEELHRDDDQDPDDDADGAADAHLEVEEGDDDDDLEKVSNRDGLVNLGFNVLPSKAAQTHISSAICRRFWQKL